MASSGTVYIAHLTWNMIYHLSHLIRTQCYAYENGCALNVVRYDLI